MWHRYAFCDNTISVPRDLRLPAERGLLYTCRQLRAESITAYYKFTRFHCTQYAPLSAWLRELEPDLRNAIREIWLSGKTLTVDTARVMLVNEGVFMRSGVFREAPEQALYVEIHRTLKSLLKENEEVHAILRA